MEIKKAKNGTDLVIALAGRLDTTTAPELEASLSESIDSVKSLTFDFAALEYVSSAGLRVLLGAQKKMNAQEGKMVIRNVNSDIREVFEITGFIDILTIE